MKTVNIQTSSDKMSGARNLEHKITSIFQFQTDNKFNVDV